MKRILLLEDNLNLLQDTYELLESHGFETIKCASIVKAKEVLQKHSINLIYTDLNLATTGLNDIEINQSFGSRIAGWMFLVNYVYSNDSFKQIKYVIRSAYIDDLNEYLQNLDSTYEKELLNKNACFQKTDSDDDVIAYIKQVLGVK